MSAPLDERRGLGGSTRVPAGVRGATPARSSVGLESGDGRLPVAVLGATGLVGQHLVERLSRHPTLRLAEVMASGSRVGARYGASVEWVVSDRTPDEASLLELVGDTDQLRSPVVLSALPTRVATEVEPRLARAGRVVCTNASAHRLSPDVPLVVPEVNPDAVSEAARQPWSSCGGVLVANPNCVVTGIALALVAIERTWGIRSGAAVTLQAISGAGLAGPSALALSANVVPWIEGEEQKIESELRKVLDSDLSLAVTCNRVPVLDGHMAHLFLDLKRRASACDVEAALREFTPPPEIGGLPTLPERPLVIRSEPDRPQPRLDAGAGGGMSVSVGRIRRAAPYDVALTVVVHNAIRGAAGACLANAELCVARGMVGVATC